MADQDQNSKPEAQAPAFHPETGAPIKPASYDVFKAIEGKAAPVTDFAAKKINEVLPNISEDNAKTGVAVAAAGAIAAAGMFLFTPLQNASRRVFGLFKSIPVVGTVMEAVGEVFSYAAVAVATFAGFKLFQGSPTPPKVPAQDKPYNSPETGAGAVAAVAASTKTIEQFTLRTNANLPQPFRSLSDFSATVQEHINQYVEYTQKADTPEEIKQIGKRLKNEPKLMEALAEKYQARLAEGTPIEMEYIAKQAAELARQTLLPEAPAAKPHGLSGEAHGNLQKTINETIDAIRRNPNATPEQKLAVERFDANSAVRNTMAFDTNAALNDQANNGKLTETQRSEILVKAAEKTPIGVTEKAAPYLNAAKNAANKAGNWINEAVTKPPGPRTAYAGHAVLVTDGLHRALNSDASTAERVFGGVEMATGGTGAVTQMMTPKTGAPSGPALKFSGATAGLGAVTAAGGAFMEGRETARLIMKEDRTNWEAYGEIPMHGAATVGFTGLTYAGGATALGYTAGVGVATTAGTVLIAPAVIVGTGALAIHGGKEAIGAWNDSADAKAGLNKLKSGTGYKVENNEDIARRLIGMAQPYQKELRAAGIITGEEGKPPTYDFTSSANMEKLRDIMKERNKEYQKAIDANKSVWRYNPYRAYANPDDIKNKGQDAEVNKAGAEGAIKVLNSWIKATKQAEKDLAREQAAGVAKAAPAAMQAHAEAAPTSGLPAQAQGQTSSNSQQKPPVSPTF